MHTLSHSLLSMRRYLRLPIMLQDSHTTGGQALMATLSGYVGPHGGRAQYAACLRAYLVARRPGKDSPAMEDALIRLAYARLWHRSPGAAIWR